MKIDGQNPINLSANIIDVREIRERIEYLELERELAKDNASDDPTRLSRMAKDGTVLVDDFNEDDENEYQLLKSIEDELPIEDVLISEEYFERYAQELASDLYGREISDAHWPFNCIDWELAAKQLEQDYSIIEIDGNTFYYRA